MPIENVKLAFYVSCTFNAVANLIRFCIYGSTLKVPLLLVGALIGALYSLLLVVLGAFAVWKNIAWLRRLVFALTLFSALINLVQAVTPDFLRIDKEWELQMRGKSSIQSTERAFNCCGKNGPEDYLKINWTIPASCFPAGFKDNKDKLFKTGCAQRWKEVYSHTGLLTIMFVLQSIQALLLGLLSSTCNNENLLVANESQIFQVEANESIITS